MQLHTPAAFWFPLWCHALPSVASTQGSRPPALPSDNVFINELIREYLEFNGYRHTLSVLLQGMLASIKCSAAPRQPGLRSRPDVTRSPGSESGQPPERALDRDFMAHQLGVPASATDPESPALLYLAVGKLQVEAREQREAQSQALALAAPTTSSAARRRRDRFGAATHTRPCHPAPLTSARLRLVLAGPAADSGLSDDDREEDGGDAPLAAASTGRRAALADDPDDADFVPRAPAVRDQARRHSAAVVTEHSDAGALPRRGLTSALTPPPAPARVPGPLPGHTALGLLEM